MSREAGAEGGEPVALIRRGSVEALLQGHQHGGAAHVAAAGEDRASLVQRKRQHIFQGLDDIASAGLKVGAALRAALARSPQGEPVGLTGPVSRG